VFGNLVTLATLSTNGNESASQVTISADGSETHASTRHNVIISYRTDASAAGPSTTLYAGRVVFTVYGNKDFALQEVVGRTTDICAALSG
jgi:hypothetical protein